jgi:hypothetical protein
MRVGGEATADGGSRSMVAGEHSPTHTSRVFSFASSCSNNKRPSCKQTLAWPHRRRPFRSR